MFSGGKEREQWHVLVKCFTLLTSIIETKKNFNGKRVKELSTLKRFTYIKVKTKQYMFILLSNIYLVIIKVPGQLRFKRPKVF